MLLLLMEIEESEICGQPTNTLSTKYLMVKHCVLDF